MNSWLQKQWATFTMWHLLLLPLSWIFFVAIHLRKWLYRIAWIKSARLSAPVIVVGNISVGGTGKTPMVIWLADLRRSKIDLKAFTSQNKRLKIARAICVKQSTNNDNEK